MTVKPKKILFGLILFLLASPAAVWADFSLLNPSVSGGGEGDSWGTAEITSDGPWDVFLPGFGLFAGIIPGGAISFQQAQAFAWRGTAFASTSGMLTDTQANGDDGATVTTSGSTDAVAQKENDSSQEQLLNGSLARLIASGGAGTVTGEYFDTETGYMLADADVQALSTGSTDAAAGTDATASAEGSATVEYRFAGSTGSENLTVTDVNIEANADVDDDTTVANPALATAVAWANGVIGWTDSDTQGRDLGSTLGVNSEAEADRVGSEQTQNGLPAADSEAAGSVEADFTMQIAPNPIFSLIGNVGGSTDASAAVTQGNGVVDAQGGKNAVGLAGTQAGAPTAALSYIVGSVRLEADAGVSSGVADEFAGEGTGGAVNPAALGEQNSDPDPAMTVTSQHGTVSSAMGSSSTVNAGVEASASVTPDGTGGLEDNDVVIATSIGFAAAVIEGLDTAAALGDPEVDLFDLANEYAFAGQGGIVGGDVSDGTSDVVVTANTQAYNLFGTASTPGFFGLLNDGDSNASLAQDADGVYQRTAEAGASSVSGSNYPVAVAHNQMGGTFNTDANSPWWGVFRDIEPDPDAVGGAGAFDHLAGAFIGGGGN